MNTDNTDPRTDYLDTVARVAAEIVKACRSDDGYDVDQHVRESADGWCDEETVCTHSPNKSAVFDEIGGFTIQSWSDVYSRAAYYAVRQDIYDALREIDDFDPADSTTWVIPIWEDEEVIGDTDIKVSELSDGRVTVELRGDIDADWEEWGLETASRDVDTWLDSDKDDTDPAAYAHEQEVIDAITTTMRERIRSLATKE